MVFLSFLPTTPSCQSLTLEGYFELSRRINKDTNICAPSTDANPATILDCKTLTECILVCYQTWWISIRLSTGRKDGIEGEEEGATTGNPGRRCSEIHVEVEDEEDEEEDEFLATARARLRAKHRSSSVDASVGGGGKEHHGALRSSLARQVPVH